jgi:hypothetical protein
VKYLEIYHDFHEILKDEISLEICLVSLEEILIQETCDDECLEVCDDSHEVKMVVDECDENEVSE